jgi:hypothetical protein
MNDFGVEKTFLVFFFLHGGGGVGALDGPWVRTLDVGMG